MAVTPFASGRPHPKREKMSVREYLRSHFVQVALSLLVFGSAPLFLIILASAAGLWPDSSPHPVGPALLFFVTVWVVQVRHP